MLRPPEALSISFALEILDEVQQSNLMDSLEDCCDPGK